MLDRLFKSKTRVKILKLLILNPTKEFYLREIQRRTEENVTSIRRELNNLEEASLVKKRVDGIQKYYKINKNSPVYEELKKLVLKTAALNEVLKNNMKDVGTVKYALIYGSFAKGDETESSDIDLLIIGDVKENLLIRKISKVERELGREINYVLWSEKEFFKKIKERNHLLIDIIKNPFICLIGDRNEFRKTVKR